MKENITLEKGNMDKWMNWAFELQALAQEGLYYGNGPFDIQRYERIREIAAAMISDHTDLPVRKVRDLFCSDVGYVTPKLDSRGAIFKDHKILLVQEKNGEWSMPGGWVDPDTSIEENTMKEVWEEAGLRVTADRLVALLDLDKHNAKYHPFKVIKAFVLCSVAGGHFTENTETVDSRYFGMDELPALSPDKNTREQVLMCYEAWKAEHWETVFD